MDTSVTWVLSQPRALSHQPGCLETYLLTKTKQVLLKMLKYSKPSVQNFDIWTESHRHLCWFVSGIVHTHTRLLRCFRTCFWPLRRWYLRFWMLSMLQWHQLELGMGLSWKQHFGRVRDPPPGICPSDGAVQESHLYREGAVLKSTLHQFWAPFCKFTAALPRFSHYVSLPSG